MNVLLMIDYRHWNRVDCNLIADFQWYLQHFHQTLKGYKLSSFLPFFSLEFYSNRQISNLYSNLLCQTPHYFPFCSNILIYSFSLKKIIKPLREWTKMKETIELYLIRNGKRNHKSSQIFPNEMNNHLRETTLDTNSSIDV